MKNFTRELKNIMTEDPGVPIMSPDELRARSQTIVILTNSAPDELLALAGPDRKATLLSIDPPMITLPYQKGVFKVRPEDIVFENHHSGRDVTEAGADETPYEKFFASAMKKFGVSSPIELSPDDTKKFFNYVDKNWEAEEETDKDATEDVSTGKVSKKDKGSYQHAYKLALKKYQIHSADELDTPEERKGFTDYVDRLWKKGDIHRDKKEASIDIDEITSQEKAARKVATARETEKREKAQAAKLKKRVPGSEKTAAEKNKEKLDAQRKRNQETIKKKAAQEKQRRDRERAQQQDDSPTPSKPDPGAAADAAKKKREKEKKSGKRKAGFKSAFGKIAGAAKSQAAKYRTGEASIPEVSPPDRKHQVKGIKKHLGQKGKKGIPKTYVDKKTGKRKETNPWALAWGQYDKYGVPSRIEKD